MNMVSPKFPVWFYDKYDNLQEGTVVGSPRHYKSVSLVDVHLKTGGVMTHRVDELYFSKEECISDHEMKSKVRTEELKKEIVDIDSLVQFCLCHVVAPAEEYTDYPARQAVIERARDLGVSLDID